MSDAISIRHVSYRFGDHLAVEDLSLDVHPGEIFGLLGPNGAGKTTTIRLINTLLPLQDGEVHVYGHDLRHEAMAVRRRLGYVPQQLSIEGGLTGRENVMWFARLFDVPRAERTEREDLVHAFRPFGARDVEQPGAWRRPTLVAWCAAWSLPRPW